MERQEQLEEEYRLNEEQGEEGEEELDGYEEGEEELQEEEEEEKKEDEVVTRASLIKKAKATLTKVEMKKLMAGWNNVRWTTPLQLPIVQPYRKVKSQLVFFF